jgi:hypothetical protein
MNVRDHMLSKIRGESDGSLLFVPRLDLWYNANKAKGTLPGDVRDLDLFALTEKLGLGYHAFLPVDFGITGLDEDVCHKSLGFLNNPAFPYRVDFSEVEYSIAKTAVDMTVTYETRFGPVTTRFEQGEEFRRSGSSYPMTLEPAIKGPDDYKKLADIFRKVRIVPAADSYNTYRNRIDGRGIAVAYTSLGASPLHHIMRELRPVDRFFLDMYDVMPAVEELCEPLGMLYDHIIDCSVETDAEVVLFGANYDDTITYPPLFEKHILPWLNKAAESVHGKGKFLLTHTDGENKNLMDLYTRCTFDIADSVCPAPMTKLDAEEYRRRFHDRTIWGLVPSVIMLAEAYSWDDFTGFIDYLLQICKPYNRLILSIADTLPPPADFDRVLYIRDLVEKVNTMDA